MGPPHFRAVCDLDGALVGRRLLGVDLRAVGVVGGGGRGRGRANEGPSIKDVRQMIGFFGTPLLPQLICIRLGFLLPGCVSILLQRCKCICSP